MPLRLAGGGTASGPVNQEADPMTHSCIQANQRKRAVSVGAAVLALIGLSACATAPMSPSLVTLPGTGRSFDQFRADDYNCRLYGEVQIGLRTAQSAAAAAMTVGTASGAPGGMSSSAFVGGGQVAAGAVQAGPPPGVIPSSNLPAGTSYAAQQRYDNAYVQCMYASGNRVPVYDSGPRPASVATQRPNIPQPPAGPPPAPPPGVAKPAPTGPAAATPPLPPPGPAPAPPPSVRSN